MAHDQAEPVTYWLPSLPATTSHTDLVRYGKIRWRIEHDHREQKTGLGLDHFEGPSFTGCHRHVTLTAAHLLITELRQDPKQLRRPDPLHRHPLTATTPRHLDRRLPHLLPTRETPTPQ